MNYEQLKQIAIADYLANNDLEDWEADIIGTLSQEDYDNNTIEELKY